MIRLCRSSLLFLRNGHEKYVKYLSLCTGQKIGLRKGEGFKPEDTAAFRATHCGSEKNNYQETHFHNHVDVEEDVLCRNTPVVPA